MKRVRSLVLVAALACTAAAHAGGVERLKAFVQDVQSGRADFTQTVTAPDGKKRKTSSGSFAFARPGRFRFDYRQPYQQLIVSDGQKVSIFDADLNQVTVRKASQALGETPAALLAGGALEQAFTLQPQPDADGLEWVQATPKTKDGSIQSMRVGFRGAALAAVEVVDGFGQRSLLQFTGWQPQAVLPAETFQFKLPAGADVIEQ